VTVVSVLRPPRVFVMAANIDSFGDPRWDWSWAAFAEEPRLSVEQTTHAQSASGSATFRVLRSDQIAPGATGQANLPTALRVGAYVLVTANTTTTGDGEATIVVPLPDASAWLGIITELEEAPVGSYSPDAAEAKRIPDGFGSATATELGAALLDKIRPNNWQQATNDGYPRAVGTPPPANLAARNGGIIGNAKLGTDGSGNPAYLWARELSDCGTAEEKLWTPWRLVTHLAQFCRPLGAPPIVLRCEDGSGVSGSQYQFTGLSGLAAWMDSTEAPELYELDGLTYAGVLDLLAGSGVGLGWRQEVAQIGADYVLQITIYSRSDQDTRYGPPKRNTSGYQNARTLSTVNLAPSTMSTEADRVASLTVTGSDDQFDEVVVQGAPLLFCGSLSPIDGNIEAGWTALQKTVFDALDPIERQHPSQRQVYASYRLVRQTAADGITIATTPGTNDTAIPLTPLVSWDGSTASITSTNTDQYLPALRVSDTIPWPSGKGSDGTQSGGVPEQATVQPGRIGVYHYDSAGDPKWVDLLNFKASGSQLQESPEVDPSDDGPTLSIRYDQQQTIARDTYTGTDGDEPTYDWRKLVITCAIPSTQRLEAVNRRWHSGSEMAAANVRKSLLVRDDSFQFSAVHAGTVLAVKNDGADPDRVATTTIIRNDFRAAQRYANELSAWAFRPRTQVTAELAIGTGTGIRVGLLITKVITQQQQRRTDSIVAAVNNNWATGRCTIQTEIPAMPGRRGGAAGSPQGGRVSVELGGTVAQVTQRTEARVAALTDRVAARPAIAGKAGGGSEPSVVLSLIGGNLLYGGIQGLKFSADPFTPTQVWDPNVDAIMQAGLGRAAIYTNGVLGDSYVLVRHRHASWPGPIVTGQILPAVGTVSFTYGSTTMTAYTFAPWAG
jgi:hypothetical protein